MHLQMRKVHHQGCVNRIRAMPQNLHISASWADTGHVQVRLVQMEICTLFSSMLIVLFFGMECLQFIYPPGILCYC